MPVSEHIGWFSEIGLQDRAVVGGKGGSLGELQRAGIRVPPGFVVKTAAFERILHGLETQSPVRAQVESLRPDDLTAITACARALQARVERASLPPDVLAEISDAHAMLCDGTKAQAVAVRSSATTEDASDASFAGLQDTYLWVNSGGKALSSVRSCWASLYSVESISYRRQRGLAEHGVAMAVVIQAMVDAQTSGVMFTLSPTTGDRSVIAIEAAWGLGSALVGGEVTPDRWVIGKITGEISLRQISDKAIQHVPASTGGIQTIEVAHALRGAPCLSDGQVEALRGIARAVERHYGCAQDIEWAVDRH
ncbi:MAG TPA: PEP/pyruvate-binding domain-containing protein, partial [Burkholderiaceae bacterium]